MSFSEIKLARQRLKESEWRQNEFVLFDGMLMESMKQMNDCCRNGAERKKDNEMEWNGMELSFWAAEWPAELKDLSFMEQERQLN